MLVPEEFHYTESHEWIKAEGDLIRVGITEFAQSQLADLTFADLPEPGSNVTAGDEVAVIESVKAAADVYAPVSGEIVSVNEGLSEHPEWINADSYGEGWLFVMKPASSEELSGLLDAAAYKALLPGE